MPVASLKLKGFRLQQSNFSQDAGVLELLRTLSLWRIKLSETEVARLLKSRDQAQRVATLHYLRILNDPAYLPIVRALLNDADPVVSKDADVTRLRLEAAKESPVRAS